MITAAIIIASIFGLCGIFSLLAALFGWNWFFRSANVRAMTFGIRRCWQRTVYGIAGVLMIAAAIHILREAGLFFSLAE